jgi:hypothetical protein
VTLDSLRLYVALLTGDDDSPMTYQTFTAAGAGSILHGKLSVMGPELVALNSRGFAVSVVPQGTDGRGRRKENIVTPRALVLDLDPRPGKPVPDDVSNLHPDVPPPSFAVRTARGWHVYWVLAPGQPLDALGPALKRLALALGGDAVDITKAFRAPGLVARKPEYAEGEFTPTIDLDSITERSYTITEVVGRLPELPQPATQGSVTTLMTWAHGEDAPPWAFKRARAYLAASPSPGQGERNHRVLAMSKAVCRGFGMSIQQTRELLAKWTDLPGGELDSIVRYADQGSERIGGRLVPLRRRGRKAA